MSLVRDRLFRKRRLARQPLFPRLSFDRSVLLQIWSVVGDRLLGAAGRASRLDLDAAVRTPWTSRAIAASRPFLVIDGGRAGSPSTPKPFRPTRRAG